MPFSPKTSYFSASSTVQAANFSFTLVRLADLSRMQLASTQPTFCWLLRSCTRWTSCIESKSTFSRLILSSLKPENVLVGEDGYIKLTDFGLSKEGVEGHKDAKSLCGTAEYLSPEILQRQGHGKATDWWSFGAIIYEMLVGLPPFYSKDKEKLY